MTTLIDAVAKGHALTDNGGLTNATSFDANVDLFAIVGSAARKDLTPLFRKAYDENPELAVRILLWSRDVRGGAGRRSNFRTLLPELIDTDLTLARKVVSKVPELGRWDDLFVTFGTALMPESLALIEAALRNGDGLCAKWMPRKGREASIIRNHLQLTPKAYRKLLVNLSSTVEQKMCAKEWDDIDYEKIPSVASARYQGAFYRNDPTRYGAYRNKLVKGEAKINASVVLPHDVVRALKKGDPQVASAQWKALPDYLEGNTGNILTMVDVSGSMTTQIAPGTSALDVAVALGLYLSERSEGIFKDTFLTFSEQPEMVTVSGDLASRVEQMSDANWGMTTNLQRASEVLLTAALKSKVSDALMPTTLLILSDMEFDSATGKNSPWSRPEADNGTNLEAIREKYAEAGYTMPSIVFWNLNGRSGNLPALADETGVVMVSGFSPTIMKSVLAGEIVTPKDIMLKTVMVDRYAV